MSEIIIPLSTLQSAYPCQEINAKLKAGQSPSHCATFVSDCQLEAHIGTLPLTRSISVSKAQPEGPRLDEGRYDKTMDVLTETAD